MVRQIVRTESPSPTCISPLSLAGINFVVSYTDASILVYDTRTGEEIVGMASLETYDGTRSTAVNSVVATTIGFDGSAGLDPSRTLADEEVVHGATGSSGVEGVVISGYEDRYIRFFDANSGQCTYTMLAHPSAIASLSLSPDGRELVSAGHDASLRFWNLEKRSCTQEITSHRLMRGEGVCSVVWSRDGRWVVGGGGDGVVKVFSR
jgi:striatin 1/3/4